MGKYFYKIKVFMASVAEFILDNVDIVDIVSRRVNLKELGVILLVYPFSAWKNSFFMVSPQNKFSKILVLG